MNEIKKEKLEERTETLEKKVAELEGLVQEQLKVKSKVQVSLNELLKGEKNINEVRKEFKLSPLEDELANAKLTKVESDNNTELD